MSVLIGTLLILGVGYFAGRSIIHLFGRHARVSAIVGILMPPGVGLFALHHGGVLLLLLTVMLLIVGLAAGITIGAIVATRDTIGRGLRGLFPGRRPR